MEIGVVDAVGQVLYNANAENKAVSDYTFMINAVNKSDLDYDTKEKIVDIINEIISDELNHANKLLELYTMLTGIEPNKD
jgi:rubrerythrin